jgi:L-lactate dehydrogenase complex protein LldG
VTSKEKILAAVKANKPTLTALPELRIPVSNEGLTEKFSSVAVAIGAKVHEVANLQEIKSLLADTYNASNRVLTTLTEFSDLAESVHSAMEPHTLENVHLAIIKAELGVAENSALWIPEANAGLRVVPFICQHLAIVIEREKIVPTMQEAYDLIGDSEYGYGAFIAGPSKTADIEQSLVLGAHGPRSLVIFVM